LARRSFIVIDVVEILEHWYARRPKVLVAESLGVDRKTVTKYTTPAEQAGFVPGGPPVTTEAWAALARSWFPELMVPELRSEGFAACNRHHKAIAEGLATNTLATVYQRLRDEQGLAVSESTLRRYVTVAFADQILAGKVTVLKDDPAPGEEGQEDYGKLGMWFDPEAGRRRALWAFVLVLACSRHMFVRPTLVMDQAEWVAAHVAAAEFFGGLPRRLVPDNLKSGVDRPDLYDPRINRAYGEFARHYGVLIDPARAGKPRDKPRVERPMPYVRDSFFAGRDYPDLQAWRGAALGWCTNVAGMRSCRPLDGAAPAALFAAVEARALVALPARAFELAQWSKGKVHPDCHVKVGKTLYSVPWRHIGATVDARATPATVAIYLRGELIKTHVSKAKGRRTDFADYPPDKVAFLQRTPAWCRSRAAEVGPACVEVISELLAVNALYRLRAAQGVLSLAERHTPERAEAACAKALAAGDPSYRTIKGVLTAGLDGPALAEEAGRETAAFLRGPAAIVGGDATPNQAVVVEAEAIVAAADTLIEAEVAGGEVAP
jgi:Integrase core domain